MPAAPEVDSDPAASRRVRRVIIKIFAVQAVTMLGLWLLGLVFGAS